MLIEKDVARPPRDNAAFPLRNECGQSLLFANDSQPKNSSPDVNEVETEIDIHKITSNLGHIHEKLVKKDMEIELLSEEVKTASDNRCSAASSQRVGAALHHRR